MRGDVLKSLEEARSEKDVLKLNCVNEKLTQIKGLLRVVQQSDVSLQEAVAKVPVVNTLCAQSSKLTEQSNAMGSAVEGIALVGVTVLKLAIPQLPSTLPKFSC